MDSRIRRYGAKTLLGISALLLAVSCASTEDFGNYNRVEVIDVQGGKKAVSTEDIPLSAVIQPEDLMVSPVIDITTLREVETPTDNVTSSAVLAQAEKKEEIEALIESGITGMDTELDEEDYGRTSATLATEATEGAFEYIDSSTAFQESIAEYDFVEGRIYELITSPKAITDFRLRPGEQIAGSPITNDSANWQFSMGSSIENGQNVQHLFIRPLKVGLDTSMIILTNERTYYFRMASFENSYMTALRFRYPVEAPSGTYVDEAFAEYIYDPAEVEGYTFDMTEADYGYQVRNKKGKPSWKPVTVFSDSVKTYIQFPVDIQNTDELPSVYIVRNGDETLVNFRYIGNMCQIDTVITDRQRILLKSGQDEQVEIRRI